MKTRYTPVSKFLAPVILPAFCMLLAMPVNAQEGECRTDDQCAVGTAFGDPQVTMETDFQTAVAGTNAGRYNTFAVLEGQEYEWSLCPSDGATVPGGSDTQLTLRNNQDEFLCFSDDVCNEWQAKIHWTATYTGEVRVQINEWDCVANTASHTMVWRCISCGSIGMDEVSARLAVSAWPNPAQDRLNVSFGTAASGRVQYAVIDALGREVLQGLMMATPDNVLQLDISDLAAGQYVLRGNTDDLYGTQLFVKH